MTRSSLRLPLALAFLASLGALSSGCGVFGQALNTVGDAACPELHGADATRARYSDAEQVNIKLRAFVQASKELEGVSAQAEAEAADACQRMGWDLGVSPQQMAPRSNNPGARAEAACQAVGFAIEQILRTGVHVRVSATPPQCQANAQAYAGCAGTCRGSARADGRTANADAECEASCKAHASFTASCTPAVVSVQASQNAAQVARLAATLQTHLPALLHAQIALGKRVIADAEVLVQVGAQLPRLVGQASAHAAACVGASANVSVNATARLKVSVQASASVTGRVGLGG